MRAIRNRDNEDLAPRLSYLCSLLVSSSFDKCDLFPVGCEDDGYNKKKLLCQASLCFVHAQGFVLGY